MALIVNTQLMNASQITAPSSVPRCQCNGHLSKTHKGLEIGECKYDGAQQAEPAVGGKGLFCYVDADQSECCEDESSRYTKYCLSYSACVTKRRTMISHQTIVLAFGSLMVKKVNVEMK